MNIIPALVAAALYTGAQKIHNLAHTLAPNLPCRVYVSQELWCHLPKHHNLVLATSSIPEVCHTLHRYRFITIAVVVEPDGDTAVILLNHRETPYALYGRDPEGYPVDKEDFENPEPPVMVVTPQMDAILAAARNHPHTVN